MADRPWGVAKSIGNGEAGNREHFHRRGQAPFRLDCQEPGALLTCRRLRATRPTRFAIGGHRKTPRPRLLSGQARLREIPRGWAPGEKKGRCSAILARLGGWLMASLGDLQSVGKAWSSALAR